MRENHNNVQHILQLLWTQVSINKHYDLCQIAAATSKHVYLLEVHDTLLINSREKPTQVT